MTKIESSAIENRPILIIEDDEAISALLKYLLEREGYVVTALLDGAEAQNYILSGEYFPSLILLDILLPSIDGYDLLKLINETELWSSIPLIILSGRSQEEDIVRAFRLGADDYVTKPFRVNELVARIHRLL